MVKNFISNIITITRPRNIVCIIISLISILFIINSYFLKESIICKSKRISRESNKFSEESNNTSEELNKIIYNKIFFPKCKCDSNPIINITKALKGDYLVKLIYDNQTSYEYTISEYDFDNKMKTCDTYSILKRGPSQKVIGFSLYGKKQLYYKKLESISYQVKKFYPEWLIRIYYDSSIRKSVICDMVCNENKNVDFCYVQNMKMKFRKNRLLRHDLTYVHAAIWRWFPLGDDFVDMFMSRDSDSYIIQREVDAVDDWLNNSSYAVHLMRDHPYHGGPMMAGMWGIHKKRNSALSKLLFHMIIDRNISSICNPNSNNTYGGDQQFQNRYMYKLVKNDLLSHDSYFCKKYNNTKPFPTKRKGDCFIGGKPKCNEYSNYQNYCPIECRPKEHDDWPTC